MFINLAKGHEDLKALILKKKNKKKKVSGILNMGRKVQGAIKETSRSNLLIQGRGESRKGDKGEGPQS